MYFSADAHARMLFCVGYWNWVTLLCYVYDVLVHFILLNGLNLQVLLNVIAVHYFTVQNALVLCYLTCLISNVS